MKKARIILDRDYVVGRVDDRLYGSFVEHLGRCVYGGIYEKGHPQADEKGIRLDVLAMVKELGITCVRYPGGNFVSGFNWEDSVGPCRPKRLDLAWGTTETNEFGLHEFVEWCEKAGISPMYSVNLGTRGPDDARRLVEYANHPSGTELSDLRIRNGRREPMNIKMFCLGNEMDGPWQMGHKTAYEYGRAANEAAKLMKWVDPSVELVACGSSSSTMPTFGEWEYTMLGECYDAVDYVSLHRYYGNPTHDTPSFLASTVDLDGFIRSVVNICDAVKARRHSKKTLGLSLDEWNVWYHSHEQDEEVLRRDKWGRALPLLEDVYNFEDALLVGSILITMLRNADRVKIGCIAQLVNVIAPIMTRTGGGVWAQTTYWPLMHASRFGRGTSLRVVADSPLYDCASCDGVPMLDSAAVQDDDGNVTVFCVNRSTQEDLALSLDLRAFPRLEGVETVRLVNADVNAVNTEDDPHRVSPVTLPLGSADGGRCETVLPRLSWSVLRFKKA